MSILSDNIFILFFYSIFQAVVFHFFYSILSYSILSYSILSYSILSVYSALLEVQYVLWEYSAVYLTQTNDTAHYHPYVRYR